jgi:hypothetical protein
MAGFDYGRMQGVATRLLTRFNQGAVTLTKTVTTPGPNDWTPGTPTDTTYTLQATAKGVSKEFIDGTTIVATDLEITAAAFPAEPDPADVLAIDGKAVTVLKTMPIPPAGTLVAWKFVVRG